MSKDRWFVSRDTKLYEVVTGQAYNRCGKCAFANCSGGCDAHCQCDAMEAVYDRDDIYFKEITNE